MTQIPSTFGWNPNVPMGNNPAAYNLPLGNNPGVNYSNTAPGYGGGYQPPGGGNGGLGGMGAYPQFFQNYVNQSQNAYNQAKQANLQRYNQGIQGYTNLYNQEMGQANAFGTAQTAEINRQFNALRGSSDQNLVNSGLSNSTIQPSVNAGIERQRGYALADVAEQAARQRIGVMQAAGNAQLGFLERRNDPYPDMNQIMGMAMQYGAGGGGCAAMGGGGMAGQAMGGGFGMNNMMGFNNMPFQPMGGGAGAAGVGGLDMAMGMPPQQFAPPQTIMGGLGGQGGPGGAVANPNTWGGADPGITEVLG